VIEVGTSEGDSNWYLRSRDGHLPTALEGMCSLTDQSGLYFLFSETVSMETH
jgi:hypothetical protein